METIELLRRFADPEVMKTLTLMQRMTAGLITTVLGMGITLVSLVVLQLVIGVMARLSSTKPVKNAELQPQADAGSAGNNGKDFLNDEEIVAAITTALALQLKTSVSNIVIRNIERVEDPAPVWQRAGITEHMNNSL